LSIILEFVGFALSLKIIYPVFAGVHWRKFSAHVARLYCKCFYVTTYGNSKVQNLKPSLNRWLLLIHCCSCCMKFRSMWQKYANSANSNPHHSLILTIHTKQQFERWVVALCYELSWCHSDGKNSWVS
jgi:hypothetical protein